MKFVFVANNFRFPLQRALCYSSRSQLRFHLCTRCSQLTTPYLPVLQLSSLRTCYTATQIYSSTLRSLTQTDSCRRTRWADILMLIFRLVLDPEIAQVSTLTPSTTRQHVFDLTKCVCYSFSQDTDLPQYHHAEVHQKSVHDFFFYIPPNSLLTYRLIL